MPFLENSANLMQYVKNEIYIKFEFWEIISYDFTEAFNKI